MGSLELPHGQVLSYYLGWGNHTQRPQDCVGRESGPAEPSLTEFPTKLPGLWVKLMDPSESPAAS